MYHTREKLSPEGLHGRQCAPRPSAVGNLHTGIVPNGERNRTGELSEEWSAGVNLLHDTKGVQVHVKLPPRCVSHRLMNAEELLSGHNLRRAEHPTVIGKTGSQTRQVDNNRVIHSILILNDRTVLIHQINRQLPCPCRTVPSQPHIESVLRLRGERAQRPRGGVELLP